MEERFCLFTVLVSNLQRNIFKIKTEEMRKYNLKSSHVSVIYYIYKYGNLSAKRLCELTKEDKSNMSRSIKYLQNNHYLIVKDDLQSKEKTIELTDKGIVVGESLTNRIKDILNYVEKDFSVEEREIMYKCLNIINMKLNEYCD